MVPRFAALAEQPCPPPAPRPLQSIPLPRLAALDDRNRVGGPAIGLVQPPGLRIGERDPVADIGGIGRKPGRRDNGSARTSITRSTPAPRKAARKSSMVVPS